jgi:hypothetical protein
MFCSDPGSTENKTWLSRVQGWQDGGCPWGTAVQFADEGLTPSDEEALERLAKISEQSGA